MSKKEEDISSSVVYFSATRADIISNFPFYKEFYKGFYDGFDLSEKPISKIDIKTMQADLRRTFQITGEVIDKEKQNKHSQFISKWKNTELSVYGQGDIDSGGIMSGLIATFLKISNLNDESPADFFDTRMAFLDGDTAYSIKIICNKKDPSIWMFTTSQDFDKKNGVSTLYMSPKLNELLKQQENKQELYESTGLDHEYTKKFNELNSVQEAKEKLSFISKKIPDKGLSAMFQDLFSENLDIQMKTLKEINESIKDNETIPNDLVDREFPEVPNEDAAVYARLGLPQPESEPSKKNNPAISENIPNEREVPSKNGHDQEKMGPVMEFVIQHPYLTAGAIGFTVCIGLAALAFGTMGLGLIPGIALVTAVGAQVGVSTLTTCIVGTALAGAAGAAAGVTLNGLYKYGFFSPKSKISTVPNKKMSAPIDDKKTMDEDLPPGNYDFPDSEIDSGSEPAIPSNDAKVGYSHSHREVSMNLYL